MKCRKCGTEMEIWCKDVFSFQPHFCQLVDVPYWHCSGCGDWSIPYIEVSE